MKRTMFFSAILATLLLVEAHAGGDILPSAMPIEPIEPIEVKEKPIPIYVGTGIATGRYFSDCYEDVTYGVTLRVGHELNQYIGLEARYIATFFDEGSLYGQKLEHVGLYVKPMLPFNENFNLYGLLGYGWTQTITNENLSPAIDTTGFSAGLGLEYDLSDKRDDYNPSLYYPEGFDGYADQEMGWGLFVDYQRLLIDSNIPDLDVLSAGITYDF